MINAVKTANVLCATASANANQSESDSDDSSDDGLDVDTEGLEQADPNSENTDVNDHDDITNSDVESDNSISPLGLDDQNAHISTNLKRLPCLAHTLQLVLKSIDNQLTK